MSTSQTNTLGDYVLRIATLSNCRINAMQCNAMQWDAIDEEILGGSISFGLTLKPEANNSRLTPSLPYKTSEQNCQTLATTCEKPQNQQPHVFCVVVGVCLERVGSNLLHRVYTQFFHGESADSECNFLSRACGVCSNPTSSVGGLHQIDTTTATTEQAKHIAGPISTLNARRFN
jgi:hypothetical protein